MTKKIEEAARALIVRLKSELETPFNELWQEYKDLEQALDPKPSREEVIEWLNSFLNDNWVYGDKNNAQTAIELLQEPQKGVWIENKQERIVEAVVVRHRSGELSVAECGRDLNWHIEGNSASDILKYMIIE